MHLCKRFCEEKSVWLRNDTFIGKPYRKCNLQYDNGWHTYIELLVHGLVMKRLHPKPCTDAAAKDRHQQECRLRNAPLAFLSLVLVNAVGDERYDIGKQEITYYNATPKLSRTPFLLH